MKQCMIFHERLSSVSFNTCCMPVCCLRMEKPNQYFLLLQTDLGLYFKCIGMENLEVKILKSAIDACRGFDIVYGQITVMPSLFS